MSELLLISHVVLWMAVLIETIALLALYHHFGEMYLNSREGRASQGPELGSRPKSVEVQDVSGVNVQLPASEVRSLIVFATTDCELCGKLREDLRHFAVNRPDVRPLVVCAGDEDEVSRWAGGLDEFVTVVPDRGHKIAARYGVGITPFCVGVDEGGTVLTKGIVNDLQGLESAADQTLSEQKTYSRQMVEIEERG